MGHLIQLNRSGLFFRMEHEQYWYRESESSLALVYCTAQVAKIFFRFSARVSVLEEVHYFTIVLCTSVLPF